jgi:hypothetical protein
MSTPAKGAAAPTMTPAEITYLAMRAGPIDSASIRARAGSLSAALRMTRIGHATVSTDGQNQVFRLTPEGRAACPSRRIVEREIVMVYPGVMA